MEEGSGVGAWKQVPGQGSGNQVFGVLGKGFAGCVKRYEHELIRWGYHLISSVTLDFEVRICPPWKNVLLGPAPGVSDPIFR